MFAFVAVVAIVGLALLTVRQWRAVMAGSRPPRRVVLTALSFVIMLGVSIPAAIRLGVSDDEAGQLLGTLLRNVYLAFDYRDEERIYDTLEQSVAGLFFNIPGLGSDPLWSHTAIGRIGKLKLSDRIVLRVRPHKGSRHPALARGDHP